MANQNDPRQVIFGSIQTCCRPQRLEQLRKNGFELLLIDEADAYLESYQTIIRGLGPLRVTRTIDGPGNGNPNAFQ